MKKHLFSSCSIMLMACSYQCFSQGSPGGLPQVSPPTTQSSEDQTGGLVLRVTTREVLVEVVALDQHQRPVRDLAEDDFSIYEIGRRPRKVLTKISSFRVIDPALEDAQTYSSSDGFKMALGAKCSVAMRFHYRLAYHPGSEGWKAGQHEILITTRRPHVDLLFRHHYDAGEMNVSETPRIGGRSSFDAAALQQAACFRSERPSTVALSAHQIHTSGTDRLRYALVVRPESLAFTPMSDQIRGVDLDYGACTFGVDGKSLQYSHLSAERLLSAKDYEEVLEHGYSNLLELSRKGDPADARIVVRDRATGNIGSINVSTGPAAPVVFTTSQLEAAKASAKFP